MWANWLVCKLFGHRYRIDIVDGVKLKYCYGCRSINTFSVKHSPSGFTGKIS